MLQLIVLIGRALAFGRPGASRSGPGERGAAAAALRAETDDRACARPDARPAVLDRAGTSQVTADWVLANHRHCYHALMRLRDAIEMLADGGVEALGPATWAD